MRRNRTGNGVGRSRGLWLGEKEWGEGSVGGRNTEARPGLRQNASSSATELGEEGTELYQMSSFYCACIMVALCVLGLIGNWLSVYVFSRKSMRCSSINVLLTGLSATDFLLLLIVVPIFALPHSPARPAAPPRWTTSLITLIAYVYPLAVILQTASVWIFMIITVERFLAVCLPLRVAHYCTVGRSRAALAVVYAAAVGYNLVRFWEYTTEPCQEPYCGSIITIPLLRENRPLLALVRHRRLSPHSVPHPLPRHRCPQRLRPSSACTKPVANAHSLSSSEKSEHRTALMMIIVVVVFASCYSLSFVLNFHEAIDPQLFYRPSTSAMAYLSQRRLQHPRRPQFRLYLPCLPRLLPSLSLHRQVDLSPLSPTSHPPAMALRRDPR